ncbi:MAG TPA: exonuclease domain-containing protein [Patescibacteria group bacterium]|jgi:DNA polymerase-3 subunit epsilon|nr:exonuclease domain-containing protein [Patescibacteria group bacterium]
MFEGPAVFVDIETNGGSGPRGRITEIAILRIEGGEITEEYTTLVNPGTPIPYWITKLTGISDGDVADAPYFDDIAYELHRLMDGAIFVAHNVRFDYSFIKRQLEACGYVFNPKLFCTVRMSRALYAEHRGHSLQKIIDRHGIDTKSRHRAYDDAKAMFEFARIAIAEKGVESFQANVAMQLKTKTLPSHVNEKMIADLPNTPGIYIFEDEKGAPLYIGKSVDIRKRVLSHFANDTKIVKEMKMAQSCHNVSYIQTETEIEALLLESAKIKELQPLHNRLLRRATKQTVLVREFDDNGYMQMALESRDLNESTDIAGIYGVYTNRTKAKARLESLTKTFDLCPKLMGLENGTGACFRHQLGMCKGACAGKESIDAYNRRVEYALERSKIEDWPFKGELAVKISETKALIVNQWIIKGYMTAVEDGSTYVERIKNGFDIDTYKILRSYMRQHRSNIELLPIAS